MKRVAPARSPGWPNSSPMLELVLRAYQLKEETRTGWMLRGVQRPESVADHSWGTALLCMVYAPRAGVDAGAAVQMALVHDLAEAISGDHATRVAQIGDRATIAAKQEREQKAFAALLDGIGDEREQIERVEAPWSEYEARETPLSQFVSDMNLIDMCAQALRYEREPGRYDEAATANEFAGWPRLTEFFATTRARLATAIGHELFAELEDRYAHAVKDGGNG